MIKNETPRARLLRIVEDGLLDPRTVVAMFIRWSTNEDIEEMLRAEDINIHSDLFN